MSGRLIPNWNRSYKQYPELIPILKNSILEYDEIYKFFTYQMNECCNNFSFLYKETTKKERRSKTMLFPRIHSKSNPGTTPPIVPIDQDVQVLSTIHHSQIEGLQTFMAATKVIMEKFDANRLEYSEKVQKIIQEIDEQFKELENAEHLRKQSYSSYLSAAENVKTCFKRNTNVEESRKAFIEAQKTAVETYTHFTEVSSQISLQMDRILSSYEEIEAKKFSFLKELLIEASETYKTLAKDIQAEQDSLSRMIEELPESTSPTKIRDFSSFPDVAADIQLIPLHLNPLFSKYVDKSLLFQKDVKAGMKLARVLKTAPYQRPFLGVVQDEVVCVLEPGPSQTKIKDINGCIGMILTQNLQQLN